MTKKRKTYHVIIPPVYGVDQTPNCLLSQPNLNFLISTVQRKDSYIHQMLTSMYLGGFPQHHKIHLMVCGPDADYLSNYRHHENLQIHTIPDKEWKQIKHWPVQQKASYNYCRCLRTGEFENSMIMEDDIIFQDRWYQKFLRVLKEVEDDGYKKYILSLFTVQKAKSQRSYFQYQKIAWACSQCIFYPAGVREELTEQIMFFTHDVLKNPQNYSSDREDYADAYDVLMKEYISDDPDFMIFCPVESLVQHIGKVSSGANGEINSTVVMSDCFYLNK